MKLKIVTYRTKEGEKVRVSLSKNEAVKLMLSKTEYKVKEVK